MTDKKFTKKNQQLSEEDHYFFGKMFEEGFRIQSRGLSATPELHSAEIQDWMMAGDSGQRAKDLAEEAIQKALLTTKDE